MVYQVTKLISGPQTADCMTASMCLTLRKFVISTSISTPKRELRTEESLVEATAGLSEGCSIGSLDTLSVTVLCLF